MKITKPKTTKAQILDAVADSLIVHLTNDSVQGQRKILNAVVAAGKAYKAADYSWASRALRTFMHNRIPKANQVERQLILEVDVVERFKVLAKVFLDPKGGWAPTSYNTNILAYFLKELDGNNELDKFYFDIIHELALPFKQKVQMTLTELQASQMASRQRESELKQMSTKSKAYNTDIAHLFSNPVEASNFAADHFNQISFSLFHTNHGWQLSWYNLFGDEHVLNLSDRLKDVLPQKDDEGILNDETVKTECLKLRDADLGRKKLLINPSASKLHGLKSIFVLNHYSSDYDLYWYDENGAGYQIDIEIYPELASFFVSKPQLGERETLKLHGMLKQIDLPLSMGIDKASLTLEKFFKEKKAEAIFTYDILVNPSKLPKALKSTFIVDSNKSQFKLIWVDVLGKSREIDLAAYSQLTEWLGEQEQISREDYPELKRLLSKVNTSQAIQRDDFKKQLAACLGGRESSEVSDQAHENPPINHKQLDMTKYSAVARLFGHVPSVLPKQKEDGFKEEPGYAISPK